MNKALKVTAVVLLALCFLVLAPVVLVFSLDFAERALPVWEAHGIESYDKRQILERFGGDLDSGLMVFPDHVDKMQAAEFHASLREGLLDTDGYLILRVTYEETAFAQELERLKAINCTITYEGQTATGHIRYDETMYRYPAYIASDGFDSVYEYALVDSAASSVIYVLLSYPDALQLAPYRDCLKADLAAYDVTAEELMDAFTIYFLYVSESDCYVEYTDMLTKD